ncbi:MAG: hypothetical protein M3342_25125 [Bacteroidota bacterium]|nr:hypothetical protein [Bacteroidota bacterium]
MKGFENQIYLIAYIISNAVALIMLLTAWKWPQIARLLFFILFAWACWANWTTTLNSPEDYIGYANLTFSGLYKSIIHGWFSQHIQLAVGFIATCQGLIAFSMLLKGWIYRLGLIGGITFLLAIMPFGVGSAFPCTLIMAIAMAMLWKQHTWLWQHIGHKFIPKIQ